MPGSFLLSPHNGSAAKPLPHLAPCQGSAAPLATAPPARLAWSSHLRQKQEVRPKLLPLRTPYLLLLLVLLARLALLGINSLLVRLPLLRLAIRALLLIVTPYTTV